MTEPLATLRYIKVERVVENGVQHIDEQERMLQLFTDRICSKHHIFIMDKVYDLSYRRIGAGEGIIYLHTHKGVYPYTVREDPQDFIACYRSLRNK